MTTDKSFPSRDVFFFPLQTSPLRLDIVLSHITVDYKSWHRQECHHFPRVTKEFVTPECVCWICAWSPTPGWRVEGGDNRFGGTVKFHCGSSRDCHHIQTAKIRSGGVSHIFKAKATAALLAANRVWAAYHQPQCELWAMPASGTFFKLQAARTSSPQTKDKH